MTLTIGDHCIIRLDAASARYGYGGRLCRVLALTDDGVDLVVVDVEGLRVPEHAAGDEWAIGVYAVGDVRKARLKEATHGH